MYDWYCPVLFHDIFMHGCGKNCQRSWRIFFTSVPKIIYALLLFWWTSNVKYGKKRTCWQKIASGLLVWGLLVKTSHNVLFANTLQFTDWCISSGGGKMTKMLWKIMKMKYFSLHFLILMLGDRMPPWIHLLQRFIIDIFNSFY